MMPTAKSTLTDGDDLPLLAHLMDDKTLEAIRQTDHWNYERSKSIKKDKALADDGTIWLPIDWLSKDRFTDFRARWKATDLRADYKPTDFRTDYKPTDFRTDYKPTDFRTNYKPLNFRTNFKPTDSNVPKTLDTKKHFPQNSPILSTEYIGNSTDVLRHSSSHTTISTDGTNFSSTDICAHSTEKFKSSDDILNYLRSHPDFQRMPPSQLGPILAAILSGLLVVGGVVLIVVSGGVSTPGIVLATSLLVGTGLSGIGNAVSGLIHRSFSWTEFATKSAITAGLTLITFGAGFGAGSLTGLALVGDLTETAIKTLGTVAGAIAGAGIRTGAYCVIRTIEGKPVEAMQLVIEGVGGAISGGLAGYLGVKIALLATNVVPVGKEITSLHDGNGTVSLVARGDGLGPLEIGDIQRLFGKIVPQDAYDVMNTVLERFSLVGVKSKLHFFGDHENILKPLLTDLGHNGPFTFCEFDVGPRLIDSRGTERIVLAFSSARTRDVQQLARGYIGVFYNGHHYNKDLWITM